MIRFIPVGRIAVRSLLSAPLLCIVIAGAAAQTLGQGLPATGAILQAKPAPNGYRIQVFVPTEQNFTEIEASSADVPLKTALSTSVQTSFTATHAVKSITIDINSPTLLHGDYPLTLTASTAAGSVERDVWLQIPSAAIDTPQTLIIRRQLGPFGGTTAGSPQIWETTRQAWLTNVRLTQKGDSDAGGTPGGQILFPHPIGRIPPGTSARLVYGRDFDLTGNFSLGSSKGIIVVEADQLASPVPVSFEVDTSLSQFWLVATLLVGLFFGWLARKGLQAVISLNRGRQSAYQLIETIDAAIHENTDNKFRTAARSARDKASAAARRTTTDRVNSETLQAQADFQVALDTLKKSRSQLQDSIAKLQSVLGQGWTVPEPLAGNATATLDCLTSDFDLRDVQAATAEFHCVVRSLAASAVQTGGYWLSTMEDFGRAICAIGLLVGTAATQPLLEEVANRRKLLEDDMTALASSATPPAEQFSSIFQELHTELFVRRSLVRPLTEQLTSSVKRWKASVTATALPESQALDDALREAASLALTLSSAAEGRTALPDKFGAMAETVQTCIHSAILGLSSEDNRAGIKALLDSGKVAEAIEQLGPRRTLKPGVSALENRRFLENRSALEVAPGEVAGAQEAGVTAPYVVFPPMPSFLQRFWPTRSEQPVDRLLVVSARELAASNFAQSAIYAFVIASAGYFLFANKWIGLPIDFAMAFFWAFAIDIGADAATAAMQGLTKK